jgi:phage shock protein PspC (stress-responsive transcriptional regulator)
MQRVVSINLDGNVYPLDEKGYTALFAYLDATDARLKDSADRARILADIERTIAEKCQACLGPHKTVITAGEIERILSELEPVPGPPADAGRAPAAAGAANAGTGEKAPKEGRPHRRLYQIREGGMVGGVCLGLATYLNIDVTVVRILFVLFAISTGGWGFLAYGGLMFILPHATTREQAQSPSYGEQQWPWDRDGWPWDRDGWPWDRDERRQARYEQRQARHEQRMERSRYRGGSPVLSALVIAFFVMLAFSWLTFWTRGGSVFDLQFPWGGPFFWGGPFYWGFPHWFGIVLFFIVFRFVLRARG